MIEIMAQLIRALPPGMAPGSSPAMSIDFLSVHSTSNCISSDFVNYHPAQALGPYGWAEYGKQILSTYGPKIQTDNTIILTDLQILLMCHLVLIP